MPEKLWEPPEDRIRRSNMYRFMEYAGKPFGQFSYDDLHRWSVENGGAFWKTLAEFSDVVADGEYAPALQGEEMPGATFFPNLRLNFAENLLRFKDDRPALVSITESRETRRLTYAELHREVARVAAGLTSMGVEPGDRIAGFIPNTSEAVIAMLATASIGAAWTSCSPDFGAQGVLDRFGQIKPRALFAANAYRYNGKTFDCLEKIGSIVRAIPEIEKVVLIPFVPGHARDSAALGGRVEQWEEFGNGDGDGPVFNRMPFNHPLYIMYSSGTTGLPKCIVHGAGGTLLQHVKELALHTNLTRESAIMYFTTCGWMMWNWLVSSLFTGCTVVLFDGSPGYPDMETLWKLIDEEKITHFGTSPKFITSCRGAVRPKETFDLSSLEVILSTGAPLLPEDFDWVYSEVKSGVQLSSISGGTDIISCFMLGNPILPVYRGELQCVGLGMDVAVFDGADKEVYNEKGELVCRKPFVSMPVSFWNDPDGERYRGAYFNGRKGIWYHGDYIMHTRSQGVAGGIVVFGRSDTTLNPGGIRIGTAEIYRIVETLPEVDDSIVVGQPWKDDVRVILFVKLVSGVDWSEELEKKIKTSIRRGATPRHTPSKIVPVETIPYTISGKKVELAVLDVIQGREPKNKAALADPGALECFRNIKILQED